MAERHVKLHYFLIVLVPILIFFIHEVILSQLFPADLNVPPELLVDGADWLEAGGRYRFIGATWLFASLVILAIALLVRDLWFPTSNATRIAAAACLGLVLMLVLQDVIAHQSSPDGPRIYDRLGGEIFELALSKGTLPGCNTPDDRWLLGRCGDFPVLTMFNQILDLVNILAGLGVGALIVGMILCLGTHKTQNLAEQAALLSQNLKRMRWQLYLSGMTLTIGMFFATSWMYWPLPLIASSAQGDYGAMIMASALFTGIYFTLLILSFYLPVALILNSQVLRLADAASVETTTEESFEIDDWRSANGLKDGVADFMRAGFALAGPILAAFAGGISPLSF